jgi:hypothetical protein
MFSDACRTKKLSDGKVTLRLPVFQSDTWNSGNPAKQSFGKTKQIAGQDF